MKGTARDSASPKPPPRLAARAVARIDAGALDQATLEDLARSFGVTSRQLRRAMRADLGLTPVAFAQSLRLARASELVEDSELPVTDAAFASGFRSLRRFNALFARAYGQAPSRSRQSRKEAVETLLLQLGYKAQYDWPDMLRRLGARAIPGVELVSKLVYSRTVRIGRHRGWVAVYPDRSHPALCAEASLSLSRALPGLVARLRRLLRLDAPPGPRAPGDFEEFEAALRDILGAYGSAREARARCGRIAEAFGEAFELSPAPLTRLLPSAADLAQATAKDLQEIGVGRHRARRLLALARATLAKEKK